MRTARSQLQAISGQLFFATFALKFLTAKLVKVFAKNAKEIF